MEDNINERNLASNSIEILTQLDGSETLLISFGGINQGIGIPVFEFFQSLKSIPKDKIFVRDFSQSWYHNGVGQLNDLDDIERYLRNLILRGEYKNVVTIGNSMGGFAAIYFGARLNVDKVYAFSPQSFITPRLRLILLDFRWRTKMKFKRNHRYSDLKTVLSNVSYNTRINIYYCSSHRLDRIHSKRLRNNKNVSLTAYKMGGHNLIKYLKTKGILDSLISQI